MAKNSSANGAFKNALLSKLSAELLEKLPLRLIDLEVNMVMYEPNEPIEYLYFPEDAVLSIVSVMGDGDSIEVGTVGREGMVEAARLLKTASVPYRCFVQVAGKGYRVSAPRFVEVADENAVLRDLMLRYVASFRVQSMQNTACNGLHNIEQRCCRWLLMTRDRVDSDDIKLSQEFLSLMLGVRRSSVTEVLGPLQAAGLVHSHRGTISILNRQGLQERVCECYRIMVERECA